MAARASSSPTDGAYPLAAVEWSWAATAAMHWAEGGKLPWVVGSPERAGAWAGVGRRRSD